MFCWNKHNLIVDVSVGNIILERAISKFLLSQKKTVVLVLSQYHFLHKINQEHKILLIKDGYLDTNPEHINQFIHEADHTNTESKLETETNKKVQKETEAVRLRPEYTPTCKAKDFLPKGKRNAEAFFAYIRAGGYRWLFLIILGGLLMEGSKVLFDLWLKDYIEKTREHKPATFLCHSFKTTLIIMGIIVAICSGLRSYWYAEGNLQCARNFFKRLLRTVIYSELPFFDQTSVGDVLLRFTADTNSLDIQLPFEGNLLVHNMSMAFGKVLIFIVQIPLVFLCKITEFLLLSLLNM